jgi:hypothetical protein
MKTTAAPTGLSAAVEDFLAWLRQAHLPPALRIAKPATPPDSAALAAALQELGAVATALKQLADRPPPPPPPPPNDDRRLHRPYADLANGWFRVWGLTMQPGTDRPKEEMRRVVPHLESLRDTLEHLGLDIIDHTGKEIPEGLDLDVLGYKVSPGLKRDRVIETVRPTVYFRDQMIQKGRVYAETGSPDEHPGAT